MKEYFCVNVNKYDSRKNYEVVRPSSLNHPKDNSVMFVTENYIKDWEAVLQVNCCVVIWPRSIHVPEKLMERHVVIRHSEPRLGFAEFFHDNNITYNAQPSKYDLIDGAYVANGAQIGRNTIIFPGVYIDKDVVIGDNCYIASGVKLMGAVKIGNNCIIRENTVIGSDGLTRMRNADGKILTIPQFGGVTIEDDVQIGALTVIAKGAIDDTVIHSGCRIDNSCFISHNVQLGEDSVVVGETIMFGSSSTGKQSFLSGNVTVRDGVHIGEKAFVGMAANVLNTVPDGQTVKGNPAK
jgi:UDP-3-O-[3-hydroxymyristoyl] glucosamine N-acyltransferase